MNPIRFFLIPIFFILLFCSGDTEANPAKRTAKTPQRHSHILKNLVTEDTILPFTVPIIALNTRGIHETFSNALLIDKEKGIFLANAHITDSGTFFEIITKTETCAAYTKKSWIDWNRDLALFKTVRCGGIASMKNARFSTTRLRISQDITFNGYTSEGFRKDGLEKVVPIRIKGAVENRETGWGITLGSIVDILDLRIRILEGKTVPVIKRHWLFEEYILIRTLDGEPDFKKGLSASPAFLENGEIAGIISGAIAKKTLVVSARHIRQFLSLIPFE